MRQVTVLKWAVCTLVLMCMTQTGMSQEAAPSLPAVSDVVGEGTARVEPLDEFALGFAGNIFFEADYLYLQPRRRALDFAIVDPTTSGTPRGSIESLNWESNSGYRIGGGLRSPLSGWEIGAYYTYFHSKNDRTLSKPPGGTLYATLTHPGFVDSVDSAVGSANLNYSVFDVDIGRRIVVSDTLTARFSGGGRFAWIDQNLNVFYDGQSAHQARTISPIDFNGAGVRVAAEGVWTFRRGFGLYGRAAGSLLAGDFRSSLSESNNGGAAIISDVTDRFCKVVPVAELGIGLSWQTQRFQARIGYEIANWFGLVDSPDFVHDFTNKLGRRVSDLSLDGLAVQLQMAF